VTGIDGFVVCELVVADISKFESVKIGALSKQGTSGPVLGIPVPRCDIVELDRGWSVGVLVPLVFFFCGGCYFLVD